MKRLFLIVLLSLCVFGCASKSVVSTQQTTSDIINSEFAYVLAGTSGSPTTTWLHTSKAYTDSYTDFELISLESTLLENTKYQLFHVVPGKYTIVSFYLYNSDTRYYMNEAAQQLNEHMKHTDSLVGSFTAEKGKLTYIGTMHHGFNPYFQSYNFSVSNKMDEVRAFMTKNYPHINIGAVLVYKPAQQGAMAGQ